MTFSWRSVNSRENLKVLQEKHKETFKDIGGGGSYLISVETVSLSVYNMTLQELIERKGSLLSLLL